MSVTEDVVKILQNLKGGGVLSIPIGYNEGKGRLKTLPFQAGGDIDKSVLVRVNYLTIYLNLILDKGSLPLIFAA